jgi:DNA-binding TFAR19-related protein (PDSD5 family)
MIDEELESIKRRKYIELQQALLRKAEEAQKVQKAQKEEEDPEEILRKWLYAQGDKVLDAFKFQYPEAARVLIPALAKAIKNGRIREPIDGGSLLQFLRNLGFMVRLETKIFVEKKGKILEFGEYLKEREP